MDYKRELSPLERTLMLLFRFYLYGLGRVVSHAVTFCGGASIGCRSDLMVDLGCCTRAELFFLEHDDPQKP